MCMRLFIMQWAQTSNPLCYWQYLMVFQKDVLVLSSNKNTVYACLEESFYNRNVTKYNLSWSRILHCGSWLTGNRSPNSLASQETWNIVGPSVAAQNLTLNTWTSSSLFLGRLGPVRGVSKFIRYCITPSIVLLKSCIPTTLYSTVRLFASLDIIQFHFAINN